MVGSANIFDRVTVRHHRDRAATKFDDHDFLFREVATRMSDRLDDVDRRFRRVLLMGTRGVGSFARGQAELMVSSDYSHAALHGAAGFAVNADEETLPFADGAFDLAVSILNLHWVNDLPGALVQVRRALRPDGLFLAAMLGGETLHELRRAFLEAEVEEEGGVSPRVSPLADLRDAGALLQRAGFALPVADIDTITVTWPDAFALMSDLRGMGESNAVAERRKSFTRRGTLFAAARRYQELFADADGRIPATFQVLYLTGWAPSPDQQQPSRPGSATTRLADALGSKEITAPDD